MFALLIACLAILNLFLSPLLCRGATETDWNGVISQSLSPSKPLLLEQRYVAIQCQGGGSYTLINGTSWPANLASQCPSGTTWRVRWSFSDIIPQILSGGNIIVDPLAAYNSRMSATATNVIIYFSGRTANDNLVGNDPNVSGINGNDRTILGIIITQECSPY